MNVKRLILTFVVIYIAGVGIDYLIHEKLLDEAYESTKTVWRPEAEMNSMVWIMWVIRAITCFFFVFFFAKGYEGRGILEGLRFGLYMGLLMSIPMAYGSYFALPIPYSLALQWFLYGLGSWIVLGFLAALLYRR